MDKYNVFVSSVVDGLRRGSINSAGDIRAECADRLDGEADVRQLVDLAFRHAVLRPNKLNRIVDVFELSWTAVAENIASAGLPVQLAADILASHTLGACENVFIQIIESNIHKWKSPTFYNASKTGLLRCINDLLKRCSKFQKTAFCGRVQMFLADFFPMSEKSALNLMSNFNVDNVTTIECDEPQCKTENAEAIKHATSNCTGILIDGAFHERFWGLQKFFADPNTCLTSEGWRSFTSCTSDVLKVFSNYKLSSSTINKTFALPKYLTSESLLDMQLADPDIRKQILIQFLILFEYLTSPVKFRPENLSADKSEWVDNAFRQVRRLLRSIPVDGERFERQVIRILKQDRIVWSNWKNKGCPNFVQKPVIIPSLGGVEQKVVVAPQHVGNENVPNESRDEVISSTGPSSQCAWTEKEPSSVSLFRMIQESCMADEIEALRKKQPLLDWQMLRLFRWRKPPKPLGRNALKIDEYVTALYERVASDCRHPPLKRPALTEFVEDDTSVAKKS